MEKERYEICSASNDVLHLYSETCKSCAKSRVIEIIMAFAALRIIINSKTIMEKTCKIVHDNPHLYIHHVILLTKLETTNSITIT